MMRITNTMMHNNTKSNINLDKASADQLNTMVATGQKITRPSDDPIIAIRALRLNTNISDLMQYYDKNIPDAKAWLQVTETALAQTNQVFTSIKENLTQGASDDNTAEDRVNILADLQALRDQIYASGNADYAGRTVFTGYRTGESLAFTADVDELYTMVETFDKSAVESFTYISGGINVDRSDVTSAGKSNTEQDIASSQIYRIRLAYDQLTPDQVDQSGAALPKEIKLDGASATPAMNVTIKNLTGDPATDDAIYTSVGADEAVLIPETGELLLGENVRNTLQSTDSQISFEYAKSSFDKGDLRPEHYFACKVNNEKGETIKYNYNDTTGLPDFKNQSIQYEVSFNQSVAINVNANQVFTHDIGRDVDELVKATKAVVDCEEKIAKLEDMQRHTDQYSEAELANISSMIDAATKERSLLKEKMQKMFSQALDRFDGYENRNDLTIAKIGTMGNRLNITRDRVSDQLASFKELADANINAELTDTAIDLSNAELALQAAQLAASKIAQQTLLNYL